MPPMIGAAIGFITSDPTPVLHMIGTSDAITTVTVISFGRSRRTEPSTVASQMSCSRDLAAAAQPRVERFVKVDDHDDTGLHGDAVERDVADPDGHREVVAEQPLQDDAAGHRVHDRQHDDHRLGDGVERHVQQHEDDEQDDRNQDLQPLAGAHLELVLPGPLQRVAGRQRARSTAIACRARST